MTGNGRPPTLGEEIANSITHGSGAALSIAGLVAIVAVAALDRSAWRIVACAIYGTSLVLLYTSSTLYHALANNRAKRVFKILDHSSIYLLIAGTYTPFTLITLRGPWGWTLFGVIWGLCVCGVVFKSLVVGGCGGLVGGVPSPAAARSFALDRFHVAAGGRPLLHRGSGVLCEFQQVCALHLAPLCDGRQSVPLLGDIPLRPVRAGHLLNRPPECQQRGRFLVQIQACLGVRPHDRGRTGRSDGAFQRVLHSFGFPSAGYAADDVADRNQRGASERHGLSGHGSQIREMALAYLLPATPFVQSHAPDRIRVGEVGLVRIVEPDVAVFSESQESDVDRHGRKQGRVAPALRIRIGGISGQVADFAGAHALRKPGLDPEAETGRVRSRQSHILIHVEDLDGAPVRTRKASQSVDHL